MGELILVTGGSRSGKSAYALRMASQMEAPRTFVATCPVLDEEMAGRVEKHQRERAGKGWHTIEEQTRIGKAVRQASPGTVLIDCLTLWVNNLMHTETEQSGGTFCEEDVKAKSTEVINIIRSEYGGYVVAVTNEIGWGVAPENSLARRFRDNAGRCNQLFAEAATHVVCVISGLPLVLKRNGSPSSPSCCVTEEDFIPW